MTTFAPTATKTNPPLQLFTMFPTGGASTLKGFTPAFGTTAAGGSATSSDPHFDRHIHNHRGQEDGPIEQFHPVRPVRHVQHAAQWAETKTIQAPGLIVRSTTATVSQWTEYSSSSVQQTEVSRSTSSTQFQSIRNQPPSITSAQYLDDLQLPTQQLDLAVQLGKGSIARKGSIGGRRPPTIKCRRSSQGSLAYQENLENLPLPVLPAGTAGSNLPLANGTDIIRSKAPGRSKTPPPRPPPPVFRQPEQAPRAVSPVNPPTPVVPVTDWNCSRSGTPPSLPANSPPPLPEREDLEFVMELSSSASSSVRPSPIPGMTDVVEINDKESVGEDGEVVRRRTIITLGPRVMAPSGGSSSSINITLLNGQPSSSQPELNKAAPVEETRPAGRVSAFNARRTIEQRRQQAQQQVQQVEEQSASAIPAETTEPAKTPPASTYLYGEQGSPASSFGGSSLRTMSISMSFDDLESNTSVTDQQRRGGGRNRTEAWYERRQSYGFEAADKLQSLLNTSGSSDVPSSGAISRSCDSLSSTVRSTSSAIDKMIPPWIKNPSPVSCRHQLEEEAKFQAGSSRLSYFGQSVDDMTQLDRPEEEVPAASPQNTTPTSTPRTPTPSIQRSESSRSATNVLEEAEPIWLRDLRVRRSLRDGRRKPPVIKSPPPIETPVWLGVKLRPTGLSLVDPDPAGPSSGQPSPTKPNYTPIFTFTNTSTSSKIQQLLRNSRENLLVCTEPPEVARKPEAVRKTEEPVIVPIVCEETGEKFPSSQPSDPGPSLIRVPAKPKPKVSSSIVIVNSSRESLQSIGADAASVVSETGSKLNHHRSIELMRMLEETPLVSTNRPLHDRMDTASAVTDTGSIYSMGEWTECSSTVTSVKNSNEDLTLNQAEVRKAKKVAFGADVKEESDQKRSRPRRIRSKSPESRLRQWQEKLEEVKSIHGFQSEHGVNIETSAVNGLPFRRFGDDLADKPESVASSTTPAAATSDTFRSLLQPRKPYVVTTPAVKESVVIDTYPMMKVSSGPAEVMRPSPTVIRNGIVNFDSSVERKIVILETETVPAPKSILKKRSIENLLDTGISEPAPIISIPSVHSGIKVSMTNQKKEPPPEQQEILPWRIHLKHVEPGIKVKVSEAIKDAVAVQQPQTEVPPWRAEMNRKKTPPFVVRSSTPENFFRGRSPSTASESSVSASSGIPGMSAAELIRNLRPAPVMMVARCEVRESIFRPPVETEITEPEPSVRMDHGYHSLEADVESNVVKRQFRPTIDESKTIDETIAQLNETIEEIRSLDVRTETPPSEIPAVIKRESTPPTNPISSRIPEGRFIVREIRPCARTEPDRNRIQQSEKDSGIQESRTFFQSSSQSTHRSSVTSNQEGPEAISSPLKQLQRLRKSTTESPSLLKATDGRPQLRADLSQTKDTIHRVSDVVTTRAVGAVRKEDQSLVTASGVARDGLNEPTTTTTTHGPTAIHFLNAGLPQPTVVAEAPEATEESVEDLVSKFQVKTESIVVDPGIRKKSTVQSVTSSNFSSRTSTATRLRTIQPTTKTPFSPLSSTKPQPAKRSNSMELTSGMPEEKAALLVRKFFGNSVIETKKSRITKTETIMEESSELSYTSSICDDKLDVEEALEILDKVVHSSYDSDDLFRPTSRTDEVMSTSSFGSALDVTETTTDDDRSIRTASSMTLTNTTRYSSCSERSVKLSDIINRPNKPSCMDSNPSSPPATPLDEFSCATSESASIPISLTSQTTTDSSSSGSVSRSGSIRRNKTQRHPTVIRRERNSVPAVAPKTPTRSRPASSSSTGLRSSASPSTLSSSGQRRRSNISDPVKPVVSKSTVNGKSPAAAPVRPPRTLQPVNQVPEVRKRSARTTTSTGSTLRSQSVGQPASRTPIAGTKSSTTTRSSAIPADRRISSGSSSQVPLANRTNRLVTITSYKNRASATKPDDVSAVSGIKVMPVAVGSSHYKIRMDQRIAAAMEKSEARKTTTTHRTSSTATSSTEKRISSRKTTTK